MAKTAGAFTGRLTLGMLHQHPTPRRLVDCIHDDDGQRYRYLVGVQPFGTRPPLFGVHVLGTNQAFYRPLADRLGPDQPVHSLGFVVPDDEAPRTVPELAAVYVNEIDRFHPDGPIALAGVSLGGYVAFEAALQLQRRGREIALLVLFDAAGPSGRTERSGLSRLVAHWKVARSEGWHVPVRRKVRDWSQGLRGQPVRPAKDALDAYADATERAVRSYRPGRFDGTMVVLHAADTPFDRPDIGVTGFGWAGCASRVEVIDVPGGHVTMLEEPHVAAVAGEIASRLSGVVR
jgi:thioesterase domain-containing protein